MDTGYPMPSWRQRRDWRTSDPNTHTNKRIPATAWQAKCALWPVTCQSPTPANRPARA